MSLDYAKRTLSTKSSRKKYVFLWLGSLILFLGLFAALITPGKQAEYSHYFERIKLIKGFLPTKKETLTTKIKPSIAEDKTISKTYATPKFDFYNILPQTKNSPDTKADVYYELNIATLKDFAKADHLKAELALLGFVASITAVYQNNIQKYQVSIGPYDDEKKAALDQQKLKGNQVKSEIKKVV
jgi:hypothetical protein